MHIVIVLSVSGGYTDHYYTIYVLHMHTTQDEFHMWSGIPCAPKALHITPMQLHQTAEFHKRSETEWRGVTV